MKYRTDLILGEAFCLFIFFYFQDSGLSVLNGLQFYFWLRDSENRELLPEQNGLMWWILMKHKRLRSLGNKVVIRYKQSLLV